MKYIFAIICLGASLNTHAFIFTLDQLLASLVGYTEVPNQMYRLVTIPAITGQWRVTIPGLQCTEYYNFQEGGTFLVDSAAERSSGIFMYALRAQTDRRLPVLQLQVLYENGMPDCADHHLDFTGNISTYFVKWVSPTEIKLCADANGEKCSIPRLKKLLP